jgi:hypothetical protein
MLGGAEILCGVGAIVTGGAADKGAAGFTFCDCVIFVQSAQKHAHVVHHGVDCEAIPSAIQRREFGRDCFGFPWELAEQGYWYA